MNRLKQRLPMGGSTLFAMTWKEKATPSGRSVCRLAASAHSTSGSASGSWPTPDKSSGDGGRVSSDPLARTRPSGSKKQLTINEAAQMAGWQTSRGEISGDTPESHEARQVRVVGKHGRRMGTPLEVQASWPTPKARDHHTEGQGQFSQSLAAKTEELAGWPTLQALDQQDTPEKMAARGANPGLNLGTAARMTTWPTPRFQDGDSNQVSHARQAEGRHDTLTSASSLTSWSTPSGRDWKDSPGMAETGTNPDGSQRTRLDQLPRQAQLASGPSLNGSPAATAKPGQLNPAFSLWLMGYPAAWASCGALAMRSFRKLGPK